MESGAFEVLRLCPSPAPEAPYLQTGGFRLDGVWEASMKPAWSGLALGILLASSAAAGAAESKPGWNWDAPPRAEKPAPRPEASGPPDCGKDTGNGQTGCAAGPEGASDSLEDTLAPPAATTPTGNRRAKKAGN